jgi:hypothetical protein
MLIEAEILHHYQSGFQGGLEAQPLLPTIKFISCGTGILPVLKKKRKIRRV